MYLPIRSIASDPRGSFTPKLTVSGGRGGSGRFPPGERKRSGFFTFSRRDTSGSKANTIDQARPPTQAGHGSRALRTRGDNGGPSIRQDVLGDGLKLHVRSSLVDLADLGVA